MVRLAPLASSLAVLEGEWTPSAGITEIEWLTLQRLPRLVYHSRWLSFSGVWNPKTQIDKAFQICSKKGKGASTWFAV
jgi:hypothetical protein